MGEMQPAVAPEVLLLKEQMAKMAAELQAMRQREQPKVDIPPPNPMVGRKCGPHAIYNCDACIAKSHEFLMQMVASHPESNESRRSIQPVVKSILRKTNSDVYDGTVDNKTVAAIFGPSDDEDAEVQTDRDTERVSVFDRLDRPNGYEMHRSRSPRRRRSRSPWRREWSPQEPDSAREFVPGTYSSTVTNSGDVPLTVPDRWHGGYSHRSRSPFPRRRSKSPFYRGRSKSPFRGRSKSPFRKRSKSPYYRGRSKSPFRRVDSRSSMDGLSQAQPQLQAQQQVRSAKKQVADYDVVRKAQEMADQIASSAGPMSADALEFVDMVYVLKQSEAESRETLVSYDFKSKLNMWLAQDSKVRREPMPILSYDTVEVPGACYVATLLLRGYPFRGRPHITKKEAQQSAAKCALFGLASRFLT
jgi:hypothetical protein